MKHQYRLLLATVLLMGTLAGCHKKLDLFPTNEQTPEKVFSTPDGYRQAGAKMFASMAVTGSPGRDIPEAIVSDEGNTGFLRQYWYLQSLSTDEAGWTYSNNTDPIGIHQMTWSATNQAVAGLYYRCYYTVTLANNFIKESTDAKLAERGISGADADDIRRFRAEARFLRAYNYWVLLDHFGNIAFTDESYAIGSGISPVQISRSSAFQYVENELRSMENELPAPRTAAYGRIDRGAAWALLARMYLNAQVYTGTARWNDAVTYSRRVIDAGYTLVNDYKYLMLADNDLNTNEFIWTIRFDGLRTQSYSGTTFLVHGPSHNEPGRDQQFKDTTGSNGTWNCIRITEQFVNKFPAEDIRGQFWTAGQQKNMDTLLGNPRNGYSSVKFRNKTRSGAIGSDAGGTFADIDFPVFRLAEMYLIYAEATVRGGNGNSGDALNYLKALAVRARPNDANAANTAVLSLPYLIDERGRELFWEGHRRTDLIRFGQFTTSGYLWAWKGGVRGGSAVDPKYNLYPIPALDVSTNPNLVQNPGY
ncbi:MAG: RagB/SusD family nutrient uptake outer membrane protein [Chitinophagaceae bacterium]|nr:MAG: RagB/SusD family nutrient uptake outer membrane protein [Chitinophagaceae bacterium]